MMRDYQSTLDPLSPGSDPIDGLLSSNKESSPTSWPPKFEPSQQKDDDIFERSLNMSPFRSFTLGSNFKKRASRKLSCVSQDIPFNRSMSIVSMDSQASGKLIAMHHSTEDFIPPVLDLTAEILTDPLIDLDSVNVVCCDCESAPCQAPSKHEQDLKKCKLKNGNLSRPRLRSQSRSRSFICTSLMSALPPQPSEEDELPQDPPDIENIEPGEENKTINFYSFNDVLNGEKELERFNTFRMSNLLS